MLCKGNMLAMLNSRTFKNIKLVIFRTIYWHHSQQGYILNNIRLNYIIAGHKYSKKSNKELCKLCVTLKVPQVHLAMTNSEKFIHSGIEPINAEIICHG